METIDFKVKGIEYRLYPVHLKKMEKENIQLANVRTRLVDGCLLYTSPSPRDLSTSRMPSSA